MLAELMRAFALVLLSEFGDKTQIMTMAFAIKYKVKDVLMGILIGVLANHGIAIALGRAFSEIIPMKYVQIIGGGLFILFAYITLMEEDGEEDDIEEKGLDPIMTVAITFFICELGDKSQLTAMALAADGQFPLVILIGTTLGMLGVSGFSIFLGNKFGDRIPDLAITILSSVVFLIFGIIKMMEVFDIDKIRMILIAVLLVEILLIIRSIKNEKKDELSKLQIKSQELYEQTRLVREVTSKLCLGEEKCKNCDGEKCLVGYINSILKYSLEKNEFELSDYKDRESLITKEYDEDKIREVLSLVDEFVEKEKLIVNKDLVLNKIYYYLEEYLK